MNWDQLTPEQRQERKDYAFQTAANAMFRRRQVSFGHPEEPEMKTVYLVRLSRIPRLYAAERRHWVEEPANAKMFEFRTVADAYAVCDLELDPTEYTVEELEVTNKTLRT